MARGLRAQGYSLNGICKELNAAKGSVSVWVRDIKLTPAQQQTILQSRRGAIERGRLTRLKNENARRQIIIDTAQKQIKNISSKELWLIGVMLYWAEGGKTNRGLVRFSNSDPEMIKLMMKFFRKICKVPEAKFRGYIHIHPHLDYRAAEHYWSGLTDIPLKQFFKTYRKMNKASKQKRDTLPFGTMDVYICSTELFLKIQGWTKGIYNAY